MAPTTTRSPPPTRSARRPAAAKASSPTTTILATLPRAAEIATSAAVSLLAQRLPCTADNAAQEFDARNVELFSQIQRSIDDGLVLDETTKAAVAASELTFSGSQRSQQNLGATSTQQGLASKGSAARAGIHRRAGCDQSRYLPASGVTKACSGTVRSHEVRRTVVICGSARRGCCSTAIWQIRGALRNGGCSRRAFLPASCA